MLKEPNFVLCYYAELMGRVETANEIYSETKKDLDILTPFASAK